MKLGIIRCAQTEDFCPGTADFKTIQAKAGAFAGVTEPIELIGFASCIKKGTPIGFPCPMTQPMMQAVKRAVDEEIRILDFTH